MLTNRARCRCCGSTGPDVGFVSLTRGLRSNLESYDLLCDACDLALGQLLADFAVRSMMRAVAKEVDAHLCDCGHFDRGATLRATSLLVRHHDCADEPCAGCDRFFFHADDCPTPLERCPCVPDDTIGPRRRATESEPDEDRHGMTDDDTTTQRRPCNCEPGRFCSWCEDAKGLR